MITDVLAFGADQEYEITFYFSGKGYSITVTVSSRVCIAEAKNHAIMPKEENM